MSQWNRKLFGNPEPLSRRELKDYLDGNLSSGDQHAIEAKMVDDPFAADAVEGYEKEAGALTGLLALDQAFQAKTGIATSGGGAASASLVAGKTWLLVGAGLIIGVTATVLLWPPNTTPVVSNNLETPVVVEDNQEDPMVTPLVFEEMTFAEIDESQELPAGEQITSALVHQNQPATTDEPVVPTPVDPVVIAPIDTVAHQIHEPVEPKPVEPIETTPPKQIIHSNVTIAWMHDLKVVDYSGLYKSPIELYQMSQAALMDEHLQAPFETYLDQDEAKKNPDILVTYTPYPEYLETAMGRFDKNDYKGALKDFKTILRFYPDDANAHFYGGLCYFNIGQWRQAIASFEKVLVNNANTFHQEARWYTVLVYMQRGKEKKAVPILEEVIAEGGFYAERAQALLDEIGPE